VGLFSVVHVSLFASFCFLVKKKSFYHRQWSNSSFFLGGGKLDLILTRIPKSVAKDGLLSYFILFYFIIQISGQRWAHRDVHCVSFSRNQESVPESCFCVRTCVG
jgi:hypothetical protein